MVTNILRDKNDIFSIPILKFIFKNKVFHLGVKLFIAVIFTSAILYGFYDNSEKNLITTGLLWGFFWPFFTLVTLPTFGAIFCGICPHAFIGKYLSRVGLQKEMPGWMQNRWIGLVFLLLLYWMVNYSFGGAFQIPLVASVFFLFFSLLALVSFYMFKNMDYCRYLCPFSAIKNAFSKSSFAFLSTYADACKSCKDQACRKSCQWKLNPRSFEKRVNMQDCTLCMDCAHACEAVKYSIVKPGYMVENEKIKSNKIDVWVYFLLIAAVSYTMVFHHTFSRTRISEFLPWNIQGQWLSELFPNVGMDFSGFLAMIYSIAIVLVAGPLMISIGSRIVGIEFKKVFYNIGYAYAPLMVIGSLNHVFRHIFITYIPNVSNAFIQLFHLPLKSIESPIWYNEIVFASFQTFDYLAVFWTFYLLIKRTGYLNLEPSKRWTIFLFSSLTVLIFLINKILVFFLL